MSLYLGDEKISGVATGDAAVMPLDSPAFTGIPTAPTAAEGDNSTQIATTEFVQTAVNTKATTETFRVLVSTTGWTTSGANKYLNITVNGLLATDNPIVDIDSGDLIDKYGDSQITSLLQHWGSVWHIWASNNQITLYAKTVPAYSYFIYIKVVR